MVKYYGFKFFGNDYDSELCRIPTLVGTSELTELLISASRYSHNLRFKALFGVIKELTFIDGKIKIDSPSKVGREKNQAFIFKRKDDVITGGGNDYFLNGERLDLGFESYDVSIVENAK